MRIRSVRRLRVTWKGESYEIGPAPSELPEPLARKLIEKVPGDIEILNQGNEIHPGAHIVFHSQRSDLAKCSGMTEMVLENGWVLVRGYPCSGGLAAVHEAWITEVDGKQVRNKA